jgi:glyoxalase family protein
MEPVKGLHHITAIARDPQINVDFYQQALGQRLIKTTVNFDDPGTYHLYYADLSGTPGTVLTFFPWMNMSPGRVGNGETGAMAYTIAPESLDYWRQRLADLDIPYKEETRFGAPLLAFSDPDGMALELVTSGHLPEVEYWEDGMVPQEHILRGFHSVTLWLGEVEPTAAILTGQMGYRFVGQEGRRYRYQAISDQVGIIVDLLHRPGAPRGQMGSGSVHHIAFRAADDEQQQKYRDGLIAAGQRVTPVRDRQYFHSIYFREPGGVLFEIATDGPGFLIDESVEELGSALRLPPWYEPQRAQIEHILPPLERTVGVIG